MKVPGPCILVIDDEVQIRRFLSIALKAHEYGVIEADKGQLGIEKAALDKPDLILLDLGLPDMQGMEVLQKIREWSTVPVIVLSVRDSEQDIVSLLNAGANDYMIKPFNTNELIARINVSLRNMLTKNHAKPILNFGAIKVDLIKHAVFLDDKHIKLTKYEYEIVRLLATNAGKVVTQQQLLTQVWGPVYVDRIEYLRVYIGQLRRKLGDDPKHPTLIITESGIGYRFREGGVWKRSVT